MTQDVDKYYEGCALIDIANKVVLNEPNPQLFIELLKALKCLCYENVKKYYVVDKFLMNVFKLLGYGFLTDRCSSCGSLLGTKHLNLEVGELVCSACKNALCMQVSEATFSALRILDGTVYDKLSTVKFGAMGEVQAFNLLSKNFYYRTGHQILEII